MHYDAMTSQTRRHRYRYRWDLGARVRARRAERAERARRTVAEPSPTGAHCASCGAPSPRPHAEAHEAPCFCEDCSSRAVPHGSDDDIFDLGDVD